MARVILISGKGGVGKTTVAAATALTCARRGLRTLVLSLDLAHSLSDSFDLGRGLFDFNRGKPVRIEDRLDVQEIDVQEDLQRHWGEIYRYMAAMMGAMGMSGVLAEELAVLPGMEDIVALLYVNRYVAEKVYDVIIVDCPPTAEAVRFVGMATTLNWYVNRRLRVDRGLLKIARPVAQHLSSLPLPNDGYFSAIERLTQQLRGIDEILLNPKITTARLVTNGEKMVVRETQRAYMYFNMYGVVTDHIIVNRMFADAESGYLASWARNQARYAEEIRRYFEPVPVTTVPMFEQEVVGVKRLSELGKLCYPDDPSGIFVDLLPHVFSKGADDYLLQVRLPFVEQQDVRLDREDDDMIIRVGGFTRRITLPRSVSRLNASGAKYNQAVGMLEIRFN